MNRRELDLLESGPTVAACLLLEQAPDDGARERHLRYVGGHALSIRWGRALAGGRVP